MVIMVDETKTDIASSSPLVTVHDTITAQGSHVAWNQKRTEKRKMDYIVQVIGR